MKPKILIVGGGRGSGRSMISNIVRCMRCEHICKNGTCKVIRKPYKIIENRECPKMNCES